MRAIGGHRATHALNNRKCPISSLEPGEAGALRGCRSSKPVLPHSAVLCAAGRVRQHRIEQHHLEDPAPGRLGNTASQGTWHERLVKPDLVPTILAPARRCPCSLSGVPNRRAFPPLNKEDGWSSIDASRTFGRAARQTSKASFCQPPATGCHRTSRNHGNGSAPKQQSY